MKNERLNVKEARAQLLGAMCPHVPFEGWSEPAFQAAVADIGMDLGLARLVCPRGAVDLAVEYHRAGDEKLRGAMAAADFSGLRYRDKVALAVRLRLEAADLELARRGASVFALPQNAATGASLIWGTSDAIWSALGDTSTDFNWYSKRMTLGLVYSSCLLFWLGDTSENHADSREFIDRRINDVMQFEKVKGKLAGLPIMERLLSGIKAPTPANDRPGRAADI
jgi:ubiquinone biosynthesis protein COQ9